MQEMKKLLVAVLIFVFASVLIYKYVMPPLCIGPCLAAKRELTTRKLEALVEPISYYSLQNGKLPETREQISLDKAEWIDGWGNQIVYSVADNGTGYELRSLGRDGQPGGENIDKDIVLKGQKRPS